MVSVGPTTYGLKGNPVQIRNSTRCCKSRKISLLQNVIGAISSEKALKVGISQKTCHINIDFCAYGTMGRHYLIRYPSFMAV